MKNVRKDKIQRLCDLKKLQEFLDTLYSTLDTYLLYFSEDPEKIQPDKFLQLFYRPLSGCI